MRYQTRRPPFLEVVGDFKPRRKARPSICAESAFLVVKTLPGPSEIVLRFASYVKTDSATRCWAWTGKVDQDGYGHFNYASLQYLAHRVAFELAFGPMSEDLVTDHLCRNRACVNPDHLEAVTVRENVMRGETITAKNAAKRLCDHGHNLTGRNLIRLGLHRGCRACRNQTSVDWKATKRRNRGLRTGSLRRDSKLDEVKVAAILKALLNQGTKPSIARTFGVSPKVIYDIARGITWKQVPRLQPDEAPARCLKPRREGQCSRCARTQMPGYKKCSRCLQKARTNDSRRRGQDE